MTRNRHSNPDGRWYAPDASIEGRRAAHKARSLANAISDGGLVETSESVLFADLHACALRTTKGRHRQEWDARWLIVRNYIIEQNLGLAYTAARPYYYKPPGQEEATAAAMENLVRCVEIFNPWRDFRFSTYAMNGMARTLWQLAYPRRPRVEDRCSSFEDKWTAPEPIVDDGLDLRLDALRHAMDSNSAGLTDLQLYVIHHRHPSDGVAQSTLKQIGDAIGLSKERVRQVQNEAFGKLRSVLSGARVA